MRRKISKPRAGAGVMCLLLSVWMVFSPTLNAVRALPSTLNLSVGQTWALDSSISVLSDTDERLLEAQGASLSVKQTGQTEASVSLFGLFPLKRFHINISEQLTLVPGGHAVGVALKTGGVLVVGLSDVEGKNPAKEAGLRAGDVILSVENNAVNSAESLTALVSASNGKPLKVLFERDSHRYETTLSPIAQESTWRMGVWVRDSTAGVGTLSFYNEKTHAYGALGHAISDADTGKLLPVRMGSLFKADIVDIRKGSRGVPGELRGSFLLNPITWGNIKQNSIYGIYGEASAAIKNPFYPDGVPVALRDSVHTGKAEILSTLSGGEMERFDVEIVTCMRQNAPAQKSMVIKVTDEELLKKTGGIVQGMSGSPIIQDGHLVGAITHVFVDDPTQGYGIYIEWMLAQTENMATTAQDVPSAA